MSPPDALREALGQVIADQRREWRREREVIEAQSRQAIAELRAQIVELNAELRAKVDARLAEVRDGAPGERGQQGEPGVQGEPGANGADGATGPQGERGEIGEPGPVGPIGERGEQGPQGERGDPGTQGERGEIGERGHAGPIGERGERGEPGANGADGAPGTQGERGERGADGATGKLLAVGNWEDRVYRDVDVVSFGGALYQAQRDTGKAPPHGDWCCIVPAGRDGKDGRPINHRGTWSAAETYAFNDAAALDGGSFVALRDDPGPCPGDGWQLMSQRGKPGRPGDTGPPGKGIKGDPGPAVAAIDMDDTGLVTLTNADGTTAQGDFGPALSRIRR